MADAVRINGNQFSWGSIKCKIADESYFGFTGVSYGDKRERVQAYGMGLHHAPRGKSRGKYSTDPVKLTGWKGSVEALRAALALLSTDGESYGDVSFTIVIEYVEPGETAMVVRLEGCHITAVTSTEEESADPLKEEIEINCMKIYRNGRTLFDASQGTP